MWRRGRLFFSLAFVALGVGAAVAQEGRARPENRRVEFSSYRLANGLRVALAPDAAETSVAVNVSFDAGSGREERGGAGAAELLQKILSLNLRRALDAEAKRAEGGGATPRYFEGVVNRERASYFSEFEAGRLDAMLSALAGPLREPEINQALLDEARLAIQNECRQSEERRFGRVGEALLLLIYGDDAHKYGATCSLSNPSRQSVEGLKAFFKTYYVASNAVLTLVGNFREQDAKKIIEAHFGSLPRGRAARRRVDSVARTLSSERRKVLEGSRAAAPTYLSAYLTVPSNHADWYALNILADIIGQGDTSRLHAALVAKKLATSVPEGVAESRGPSLFRIGAALAPDARVEAVEAVIDAELARIRRDGVTQAEMDKARAQESAYSAEQLGSPLGRASFLARSTLYYDDPARINTELGRLLSVSAKDVRRVARKYLAPTNRAVVIELPAPRKTP